MKRFFWAATAIAGLAVLGSSANAASFDCKPYVEKRSCPEAVVCGNSELSALDDKLALSYQSVFKRLSVRSQEKFQGEQRGWIAERNKCGCDTACLSKIYQERVTDLTSYEAPTGPLVIGYDGEGRVDARMTACLKDVRELTAWSEAETRRGAEDVCVSRKRHADAYAALQTAYSQFRTRQTDRRLAIEEAVVQFRAMINACIAHKSELTTGGHNIQIDIIANEIAASCLTMGSAMLKRETDQPGKPW